MIVIPTIDMKDRQVVRLKQGRMVDATIYSDSVVDVARKWLSERAERLHLVDLNGAFSGKPVHFSDIKNIRKEFPKIKIEVGGGIRDEDTLQKYFDVGVDFCILGTVAVQNQDAVIKACEKFPGKIILGVDARDGSVATQGWDKVSKVSAIDLVKNFKGCDIESVIYTDISKDGMLAGMNFPKIKEMQSSGFPLIASGGLSSLADIQKLCAMNVFGVIAGKALYEGRISLKDAIALCHSRVSGDDNWK
jgi:phosphoribosylformimino-5-aminoimidazole carboxamide ribotide isomerase